MTTHKSAGEFLQAFVEKHEAVLPASLRGKLWTEITAYISPNDAFAFSIVPFVYRPFDRKYLCYTGRAGLIGHPRYRVMKNLLPYYWWCGTERLLWVYEDKTDAELLTEMQITWRNITTQPFDRLWLADFNCFRVASAMRSVPGRPIPADDIFGGRITRRIYDYDPYYRPKGFCTGGRHWEDICEKISAIVPP